MAQSKSYTRWWVVGAIAFGCIPLIGYLFFWGWVRGEEFSPDDFSRRSFSYNEMPIFKVTVWGIEYHDMTPVFEQTLKSDGFVTAANPIKKWDLVIDNVSDTRSSDFDARFLCRFLDLQGENNESVWIKWNEDHPELAVEFWPAIADLAREYLYLDLSNIMLKALDLAKEEDDSFHEYLLNAASTAFLERAGLLKNKGDTRKAVDLYTKSLNISASKTALLGRAECYKLLGDSDLRKKDLSAVEKIDKP